MSAQKRRVVITGVGTITPLGSGNTAFWQGLSSGRTGVRPLQAFPTEGVATSVAAEVPDFEPKKYVKQRKSLKVMARDIQLAVGAAQLALDDGNVDSEKVDSTRFGVNFGAGYMTTDLTELGPPVVHSINGTNQFDLKKWGDEGMEQLFPLWMLKYLPNMPACHVSILQDAQGPNNSITAGEASATLALGEAYRVMSRGAADIFVCGGTDCKIHPLSLVRLAMTNRLSRCSDPDTASRPFDKDRDGLVVGEGAGALILEELGHAKSRQAAIYGEVAGFGAACHPKDSTIAIRNAVTAAMRDADLPLSELGHIVGHGNSCIEDDRAEWKALAALLGDSGVPVVGYKGYLGSLAAAAGSVELIASLLALKNRVLLGTLNFKQPDPEAPPLNVATEKIDYPEKPFVKYDLSHSGQCAAVVVKPFGD